MVTKTAKLVLSGHILNDTLTNIDYYNNLYLLMYA